MLLVLNATGTKAQANALAGQLFADRTSHLAHLEKGQMIYFNLVGDLS